MKSTLLSLLLMTCLSQGYSQNCTFEWAEIYGDTNDDSGRSITNDATGNIFVGGQFRGTVDFDPGVGVSNLSSPASNLASAFLQKLDPNGNLIWVKPIGAGGYADVSSVITDNASNIVVAGTFSGVLNFDTPSGTTAISSNSSLNDYVLKFDPDGNCLWAKSFGNDNEEDLIRDVVVDSDGNIYSIGLFLGTTDFDPGSGTANLTALGGTYRDIFIQKLTVNGEYVWAKKIGNSSSEDVTKIAVNQNNLLITGGYKGQVDFDPSGAISVHNSVGNVDAFLLSLTTDGNYNWSKSFGSAFNDQGYGLAANASGEIYMTGSFEADIDLDPDTGVSLHSIQGNIDLFVVKLNQQGQLIWGKTIGGSDYQYSICLAENPAGGAYISGLFHETSDFDPDSGIVNKTAIGEADIFLLALDENGNYEWVGTYGNNTNLTNDYVYDISVDNSGNIYSTGWFVDTVDFDPGNGTHELSAVGLYPNAGSDIFIQKMNPNFGAINENSIMEFTVFPNPASSGLTISQETILVGNVQIIDMNGNPVFNMRMKEQSKSVDISFLSQGTYIIELSNERGSVRKLIAKN